MTYTVSGMEGEEELEKQRKLKQDRNIEQVSC